MDCTEPDQTFALPNALIDTTKLTPAATAVRAAMLEGLTTVEAFAEGVDKSKRTVDAWIAQGMPTVRVGRTVYIPILEARAWLLRPSTTKPAARSVGRPRKAA